MTRSAQNVARWWSGYVRSRNSTRLAQYQPAHKPRLQLAARITLWLQACVLLGLMAVVLSGCSSIPGAAITEAERPACEIYGCTVWTSQELLNLAGQSFLRGYHAGLKSI